MRPVSSRYLDLADHYDSALRAHGDTARGADWPNQQDRELRFEVMLDLLRGDDSPAIELLDFACGSGDLLRHLTERPLPGLSYRGADISADALALARAKFPGAPFTRIDILKASDDEVAALAADYCVIDGLFTVKADLTDDEMWSFLTTVVTRLWGVTRKGIAFNVMSKQVDHERSDLFHLSFDRAAGFLHGLAGRSIAFRADYGLYEYTCYAFRQPRRGPYAGSSEATPPSSVA